jgi:hypothetical protein
MQFKFMDEALAAKAVKEAIEQAGLDDEQLVQDMIEGETSFLELSQRLLGKILETKAMVSVQKEILDSLKERKIRFETREEQLRALLQNALNLAGLRKLEFPEATVSVTPGRQSVVIVDEGQLPDEFMKIEKRPDKSAIKEVLARGLPVEGAALSNGAETLTVRVK